MKTCPHCHIQVGGDTGYCPLCQNRLSGEQGSPWFPPTAPRIHRASLFYKIVTFIVLTLTVIAGAVDFLLLDTAHLDMTMRAGLHFSTSVAYSVTCSPASAKPR